MEKNIPIYLDNQATTPLDPNVFSSMKPWLENKYGNPASRNHIFGWEADDATEIARESVASSINALPKEIIFTSGATESNNLAIINAIENYKNSHMITMTSEHKAILDICKHLNKKGLEELMEN